MFDTIEERQAAFGFGFFLIRINLPWPDGSIDADNRAYSWGNFVASAPNPYYIDDYVVRANRLLIEQFKWRG